MRKVLCITVILLSGCVTVADNYSPKSTEVSEPPLNSVNTAHVGDSLVRQGRFTEHDAILLRRDVSVGTLSYTLKKGYYLKQGDDKTSEFYQPSQYENAGSVVANPFSDPWKAIQAYKDAPTICVITVMNAAACNTKAEFVRTKQAAATADSFQQTLIYNGRIGDKINIGYREYSNNFARPAFNNDVEYDLKSSKIIGYKGARLEVIEATNELIKYRLIQNFSAATR